MNKVNRKEKQGKPLVFPGTFLEEANEFVRHCRLSEMRRALAAGHTIAAFDAFVYCKERNLDIPDWASNAILEKDYVLKGRKGQKPAHRQYLQYVKEAVRYLAVHISEDSCYPKDLLAVVKQKRQDKFERAFELLEGHWAATQDCSGLKKSFFKFRGSGEFYLSYIFYGLDPKLGFLYEQFNHRRVLFDPMLTESPQESPQK